MSSSVPLLSVVIPTYNYGSMLPRALSSILLQMDARTELLVVDDGSSDNTQQILAELPVPPGLSFRFVRQDNAGAAAARNHGLRLSCGRYVLFVDADDEIMPNALDAIFATLRLDEGRAPGVMLGARISVEQDGREKYVAATPVTGVTPYQRVEDYLIKKRISMRHGACVFRRDLIEACPYPEHLRQSEDKPVFAYLFASADFVTTDVPLLRAHKHADSLRRDGNLAQSTREALLEAIFERLPPDCQALKPACAAKQYLAVFRVCYRSGDWQAARDYFRRAWRADWRQTLNGAYLGKYLRLCVMSGRGSRGS